LRGAQCAQQRSAGARACRDTDIFAHYADFRGAARHALIIAATPPLPPMPLRLLFIAIMPPLDYFSPLRRLLDTMSPPSLFLFDIIFRFRLQLLPVRHVSSPLSLLFSFSFHYWPLPLRWPLSPIISPYFAAFGYYYFRFSFRHCRYFDISFHIVISMMPLPLLS
jgi:hypothetical protein